MWLIRVADIFLTPPLPGNFAKAALKSKMSDLLIWLAVLLAKAGNRCVEMIDFIDK